MIGQGQAGEIVAADFGTIREERRERVVESCTRDVALPSRALQVRLDESCRWRRLARRTDLRSQSDESVVEQQFRTRTSEQMLCARYAWRYSGGFRRPDLRVRWSTPSTQGQVGDCEVTASSLSDSAEQRSSYSCAIDHQSELVKLGRDGWWSEEQPRFFLSSAVPPTAASVSLFQARLSLILDCPARSKHHRRRTWL